jgi:hypothetical protein
MFFKINFQRKIISLTARLHIKGHEQEDRGIRVLSCNFSFMQEVDNYGQVSSSVRAGLIDISIPGIKDTEIVQWMLDRYNRKSGKISFIGMGSGAPQEHKSLEFEDAVLVNYNESFADEADMVINLTISARKITISNARWEGQWDIKGNDT